MLCIVEHRPTRVNACIETKRDKSMNLLRFKFCGLFLILVILFFILQTFEWWFIIYE